MTGTCAALVQDSAVAQLGEAVQYIMLVVTLLVLLYMAYITIPLEHHVRNHAIHKHPKTQ